MYPTGGNPSYDNQSFGSKSPPPLQHPVPQHPIPDFGKTVHRTGASPNPNQHYQYNQQQQQPQAYNPNAYSPHPQNQPQQQQHQQQQQNNLYSQFGFNDPAAQMGMQFAGTAMAQGSAYVEKNINRWIDIPALRHYFNVSNTYVMNKLKLLLFPWTHKSWNRLVLRTETGQIGGFKPPREDLNSPDLYIPVMAGVTYVLLCGLSAGLHKNFHPELLYLAASTSAAIVFWEIIYTRLGCYFLSIPFEASMLDLLSYYGYKFVGTIVTDVVTLLGVNGWMSWGVYIYTGLCVSFFLLRSMRHIILPDSSASSSTSNPQRKRRLWFLLTIAALQLVYMFFLIN
ncbi:YIF1-domain-containing protein [Backusella circina FSU 941]|nr:YIF1-domain-containing protein [Backusella circina FSU 941]